MDSIKCLNPHRLAQHGTMWQKLVYDITQMGNNTTSTSISWCLYNNHYSGKQITAWRNLATESSNINQIRYQAFRHSSIICT